MKSRSSVMASFAKMVPGLLRDIAGICGVSLVSYGAWLIYPPAGFIVGGMLLTLGTLLLAFAARSAG
jgi:hypothetical protein